MPDVWELKKFFVQKIGEKSREFLVKDNFVIVPFPKDDEKFPWKFYQRASNILPSSVEETNNKTMTYTRLTLCISGGLLMLKVLTSWFVIRQILLSPVQLSFCIIFGRSFCIILYRPYCLLFFYPPVSYFEGPSAWYSTVLLTLQVL